MNKKINVDNKKTERTEINRQNQSHENENEGLIMEKPKGLKIWLN